MCSSEDKNKVLFNVQLKARTLTEKFPNLDVFAIYNCKKGNLLDLGAVKEARQALVSKAIVKDKPKQEDTEQPYLDTYIEKDSMINDNSKLDPEPM